MINLVRRDSRVVSLQKLPVGELGHPNTSTMAILTKLSDSSLDVTTHLQGPNSIPADIVFLVREKPHHLFIRQHNDLIYKAKISLEMALTGFSLDVQTLDGRLLTIPVNDIVE
ncbi:hypothetical protein GOODEAATRI_007912 [Goodea atripinnis]|uniref:Chaperone DnaJ C-terminal domain-containing protein n=1 Tax=Goodea atripinnis TaxID=208336 RepID=A0ABV0N8X6_9TELE